MESESLELNFEPLQGHFEARARPLERTKRLSERLEAPSELGKGALAGAPFLLLRLLRLPPSPNPPDLLLRPRPCRFE
jgi:hypothetical protein